MHVNQVPASNNMSMTQVDLAGLQRSTMSNTEIITISLTVKTFCIVEYLASVCTRLI